MEKNNHKDKIAIGSDHAGFHHKTAIVGWLKDQGYDVFDAGTDSEASTDYPDHIHPVADAVEQGDAKLGIILCGSGNGAAMTANKHQGIRAALCWNTELAALARQHNDANIQSLFIKIAPAPLIRHPVMHFIHMHAATAVDVKFFLAGCPYRNYPQSQPFHLCIILKVHQLGFLACNRKIHRTVINITHDHIEHG